jgi:RES domain
MTGRPRPRPPLDVALEPLAAGSELVRVHHRRFAPREFNRSRSPTARFRPFGDPVVPTLFAARDPDAALAESVFHDVPSRGTRQLARAALADRVLSRIAPRRDLTLMALHGYGLQRLGVTHGELIEAPASAYAWTAEWARALHAMRRDADGMVWMARRFTGRPALILFGDRVGDDELAVTHDPVALWHGDGLEQVEIAAQRAGVALLI